jgi:hypothetical protein
MADSATDKIHDQICVVWFLAHAATSKRTRNAKRHIAPVRVTKTDFLGVQQQPIRGIKRFTTGVESITENWVTDRLHMNAQLVGAARQRVQLYPGSR